MISGKAKKLMTGRPLVGVNIILNEAPDALFVLTFWRDAAGRLHTPRPLDCLLAMKRLVKWASSRLVETELHYLYQ